MTDDDGEIADSEFEACIRACLDADPSLQEDFVYGVEWGRFYGMLTTGLPFEMAIYGKSLSRIKRLCFEMRRGFVVDDQVHVTNMGGREIDWVVVHVDGADV